MKDGWKNIKSCLSVKLLEKGDKANLYIRYNPEFLTELKNKRVILAGQEGDNTEIMNLFGQHVERYKASALFVNGLGNNTPVLLGKKLVDKGEAVYECSPNVANYEEFINDVQKAVVKLIKLMFSRNSIDVSYLYREREEEVEVSVE